MTDITDPRDVRYTDCWPLKPGRFNLVGQRKPKWLIAAIDAEEAAWRAAFFFIFASFPELPEGGCPRGPINLRHDSEKTFKVKKKMKKKDYKAIFDLDGTLIDTKSGAKFAH